GASYNVLGTFQYDNIGYVMNPGLMYQIYVNYSNNNWFYQNNWSEIYSLPLTPGTCKVLQGWSCYSAESSYPTCGGTTVSLQYCANWNVNINGSLSSLGTTQQVHPTSTGGGQIVGTVNYVEVNWQQSYSGGSPFPNPPISNPSSTAFVIKFVGFVQVQQQNTNIYVFTDDGSNVEYSQFPMINIGFSNWTTNNPNFVIQAFYGNGGVEYSGSIPIGDYAFEYDYYQGGGGSYTALWSNNPVYYYSPAFPPNGVMPSISIIPNVVQIIITNSQSTATPAPFQQDIAICNNTISIGNNFAY
ncbi:MAG: hypothetical protein ACP5G1_04740, partial [Nanopusillaceae archaeon]